MKEEWYLVSMVISFLEHKQKKGQLDIGNLHRLLVSLRNKEQSLSNPVLKEWIDLKNQIRVLERTLKELKHVPNRKR